MSTEAIEDRLGVIAAGEMVMVKLAQDRLTAAIGALLDGNFDGAADHCRQALGKLGPLAESQNSFSRLAAGATVVLVPDIAPGMTVIGWGVVTKTTPIEPTDRGTKPGYKIEWMDPAGEERSGIFAPESEVIVWPPESGPVDE